MPIVIARLGLLQLPVNPDVFEFGAEPVATEYASINRGGIKIPYGRNPETISWRGEFYGPALRGVLGITSPVDPVVARDYILNWTRERNPEPLTLLITHFGVNMDVYCGSFRHKIQGGFGSIPYEIELYEARPLIIRTAGEPTRSTPERTPQPLVNTYYTKPGDTWATISKNVTQTTENWEAIMNANPSIQEEAFPDGTLPPGRRVVIPTTTVAFTGSGTGSSSGASTPT